MILNMSILWKEPFWRYICLILLFCYSLYNVQNVIITVDDHERDIRRVSVELPNISAPISADEVYRLWVGRLPELSVDATAGNPESILHTKSTKYRLIAVFKDKSETGLSMFGLLQPIAEGADLAAKDSQTLRIELGSKVGPYTVSDIQLQQVELKSDAGDLTLKVFNTDLSSI